MVLISSKALRVTLEMNHFPAPDSNHTPLHETVLSRHIQSLCFHYVSRTLMGSSRILGFMR